VVHTPFLLEIPKTGTRWCLNFDFCEMFTSMWMETDVANSMTIAGPESDNLSRAQGILAQMWLFLHQG